MAYDRFDAETPVVGMVHLPALPGAPEFEGDREAIHDRAVRDARALEAGGVDGLIVENFGDVPFYPDDVPKHAVASMTAVTTAVGRATDLPVGVNVLRNDPVAAVSIAAATDAAFVRVNVHVGARVTDQGVIEGRAHETLRLRDRLDADVDVFADLAVKHSSPLGADEEVADLVRRGLADVVVVSGRATGEPVDADRLEMTAASCRALDVPMFVGSGVTPDSVGDLLAHADGVVVGSALKVDGDPTNPVEQSRVERLVAAARQ